MRQQCPNCQSPAFKRNGYTRHGKQNHRCLECGRQFSLEPEEATSLDQGLSEYPLEGALAYPLHAP